MFYSRMKEYPYQRLECVDDGLGYKKKKYTNAGNVRAYIVKTDLISYAINDLNLDQYRYTGYTYDAVKVGDKIGDYEITEVSPHKSGYSLYLSTLGGKE